MKVTEMTSKSFPKPLQMYCSLSVTTETMWTGVCVIQALGSENLLLKNEYRKMFSILTQNNYLWEENAMWHVHIGQDLIQSNVENSFGHSKCWSRQHSFIASKYVNRRCLVNKISIQDYKVHTKEKKEHSDRSWSIISSSIKHVCLNFYWMSLFYFVYVYLHLCSMIKAFKKWCGFSWLGLQGLWSQEILLLLFSINSWWHH